MDTNAQEAQVVFDKVVKHLLTQGVRAQEYRGFCRLRGDNGTSCAIGCLISDEDYDGIFETFPLNPAPYRILKTIEKRLGFVPSTRLLNALRCVHDKVDPVNWAKKFKDIAKDFDLSTNVIETFYDHEGPRTVSL